ncbi:hypothetical protein DC095_033230, partial [Streptomyces xinghaiensis]
MRSPLSAPNTDWGISRTGPSCSPPSWPPTPSATPTYELVSAYLAPHPGSVWNKGPDALDLSLPPHHRDPRTAHLRRRAVRLSPRRARCLRVRFS